MVRSDIIKKLSKKIHHKIKKSDLDRILQVFIDTIIKGIKSNKSTEIRSFGRFSVKRLKEKISRNPRTGSRVFVPEKVSIAFKKSNILKNKINEKGIKIEK